MKRIYLFLLALLLVVTPLLTFTGCMAVDPPSYYFNADEISEKATKIELVVCTNENPKMIRVDEDTVPSFDIEKAVVVKELEKSKYNDFAIELSRIIFHCEDKSVNAPLGHTLLIHMENGEVIVLSCTISHGRANSMVAKFTEDGTFIEHIAFFAAKPHFDLLLSKYFHI